MVADAESGIQRAIDNASARHWINSPAHASATVRSLNGIVKTLEQSEQDDPLLYAYELKDQLPKMIGLCMVLYRWVNQVTEATPDQLSETGAQLCR